MPHDHAPRTRMLLQLIATACLLACLSIAQAADHPRRILFIGNSLTYVNNLPSAVASLAPADVVVDAFARPGASLVDEEHNARVADLLAHGHYDDVVFQERGGENVCAEPTCAETSRFADMDRASKAVAAQARAGGAKVYYLGTYQGNPVVVPRLIAGEKRVATLMDARYIEIGQTLLRLRQEDPNAAWLNADGEHPGHALTALMAIRVWEALSGERVTSAPCVGGTLYYHSPSEDGFFQVDRKAKPVTCLITDKQVAQFTR